MSIFAIAGGIILAVFILFNLDSMLTAFKWVVLSIIGLVAVSCFVYWAENAGMDFTPAFGVFLFGCGVLSIIYCELTD